jgi:hypothetical protein
MGRVWALYYILIIEDAVRQSLVDDNYAYRAETVAFAPSSHPACNGPQAHACLLSYLRLSSCLSSCQSTCLNVRLVSMHGCLPSFLGMLPAFI